jgi:hypothetical protein
MNFTKEEAEYLRYWLRNIKTDVGRKRLAKESWEVNEADPEKYEMQAKAERKYATWALHCQKEEEQLYEQIYESHNEWHEANQILKKFRLNSNL